MSATSKRIVTFLLAPGMALIMAVGVLASPIAVGAGEAATAAIASGVGGSGRGQLSGLSELVSRINPGIFPSSPSLPAELQTVITSDLADATIGRYGTRTRATFKVKAEGSSLRYKWQYRPRSGGAWTTIPGATSARYTALASAWPSGTRFRVIVRGTGGKAVSSTAKLRILYPTRTPALDAERAFGLSGLRQGVDLSAYQHTPAAKVKLPAIAAWAGADGFAILRNGSGARPTFNTYTDLCTGLSATNGRKPAIRDCAYPVLADAAHASGLSLGHYWFNGWISSIDTTERQLFARGFSPTASAKQFVQWLITDGNYTRKSAAPLVLDVEAGRAWTKTYQGTKYTRTLRAWNPREADQFLTTVKELLTRDGYRANLYVYMSANAAARQSNGVYVWSGVARVARLWVASWGTNNGRIPDKLPKVGPWAAYGGWSIWQYTSNARIPGDGVGAVDGDIAKADAWTQR